MHVLRQWSNAARHQHGERRRREGPRSEDDARERSGASLDLRLPKVVTESETAEVVGTDCESASEIRA